MDRITKWRYRWRHSTAVQQLLVANVLIFLLLLPFHLFGRIGRVEDWLGLFPDGYRLTHRFWGLFSYMWIHTGLWHIFFNMVWLYWLGNVFLRYRSGQSLVALYVLGGVCGGLCYIGVYALSLIPGYTLLPAPLVGSSAAVFCIAFAVSFHAAWEFVSLPFVGRIRLRTIVVLLLIIDLLLIGRGAVNIGGRIAHIGGASLGWLYSFFLNKQHLDITQPFTAIYVLIRKRIRQRHRKAIVFERSYPSTSTQLKDLPEDTEVLNYILEKIRQGGYGSLNAKERSFLFNQSRKGK